MVQLGASFRQETHPLTFMLQTYDADILRTYELHWQQPWNYFFVFILKTGTILSQLWLHNIRLGSSHTAKK